MTVLGVGVLYIIVGLVTARLAQSDSLTVTHFWRGAAWILSAVLFFAHIWIDRVKRQFSRQATALRAAAGVAIGGFGLAVAAVIHSLSVPTANHTMLRLSLILWPLLLGIPAFVAALVLATLLRRDLPATPK